MNNGQEICLNRRIKLIVVWMFSMEPLTYESINIYCRNAISTRIKKKFRSAFFCRKQSTKHLEIFLRIYQPTRAHKTKYDEGKDCTLV